MIKIGTHEGPNHTYFVPEYMKPWRSTVHDFSPKMVSEDSDGVEASVADAVQGGRMCGGSTGDFSAPKP